jgi:hypothetical protein
MSSWGDVEPHLGFAIGLLTREVGSIVEAFMDTSPPAERVAEQFLEDAKAKYERGNAEHNDSWVDWDEDRFVQECRDEILDAVIYLAMMRSQKEGKQ